MSKAFLIGHSVFSTLNNILCRSYESDNREYTNRHRKIPFTVIAKITVDVPCYRFRNVSAAAAANEMAMMSLFKYPYTKNDRIDSLNYGSWEISLRAANLSRHLAKATCGIALKYIEITLTAEKYNVLVDYSYSIKFLNSSGC